MKTCCFIGHRNVEKTKALREQVKTTVLALINEGTGTFLFGSMSAFDELCLEIVTEIKKEYPEIKRVNFRMRYRDIAGTYERCFLEGYDESVLPNGVDDAGRASYVERNQAMVDASDACVFYYDENYAPKERKYSRRNLVCYQPKSGTKLAFEYAIKKKKKIINLFMGNNG